MIKPLIKLAAKVPARQLQALSYGMLLIVGALSLMLVGKSVSALQATRTERLQHESTLDLSESVKKIHAELFNELKESSNQGLNHHALFQANEITVEAIREFNRYGEKHQAVLANVSPGVASKVMNVKAIPFQVEVNGSYRAVVGWLIDCEKNIPLLSVSDFELMPNANHETMVLKARLFIYADLKRSK